MFWTRNKHIAALQAFHRKSVKPYLGAPTGCSKADVAYLEARVGQALPAAYRQWLLWMGRDQNGVLRGTDCFVDDANTDTSSLSDLHGWDYDLFPIPERALIFLSHQGYIMAWFLLPALNDDPTVYFFREGAGFTVPQDVGTFTEFMFGEIRGSATLLPQLQGRDW